jgi:GTP-binding protein
MSRNSLPIVAIVGRANVGKSSLFNAILNRRETIVAKEAGTTRDAITAKAEYQNQHFWLVDTAGVKSPEDQFEFTIQEQIEQAADSADVIWVVVEAGIIITDEDRRVAKMALKTTKPVFLVVNKIDRARKANMADYLRLGIKTIIPTSAIHRRGIDELLSKLVEIIPKAKLEEDDSRISLALLGRPNVGKSQLFNALANKQQALVGPLAGTTRDINRATIRFEGREIQLMDTAGIRRSGKITRGVERFSVIRALAAIEQADVCLLLMDVNELNVGLDQKIAGLIDEAGKGLILVVSKWDDAEGKDAYTRDALAPQIVGTYDFVPWAPLIFTSAVTGQNVTKIFELCIDIVEQRAKKLKTPEVNRWLKRVVAAHPPAGLKSRNPKLNYMVQEKDNPTPAFKIFGSQTKFIHWSYKRYLDRQLRQSFGFEGTPIQIWFIEKHIAHKHGVSPTKGGS